MSAVTSPPIYGLLAEFGSAEELVDAARRSHREGYRRIEAYSPYPIEGLAEAAGHHGTKVPWIVLASGVAGAIAGFGLQYWTSVHAYAHNVGGRPFNSWPAFIPVTFETTVLFSAFGAVLGMLALNGLPQPYHPLFNVSRFRRASRDGYFLCVEARDPNFDRAITERFLRGLDPIEVHTVDE